MTLKCIAFTQTFTAVLLLKNTKTRVQPHWEHIKESTLRAAHCSVYGCVVYEVLSGTGLQEITKQCWHYIEVGDGN